jgi:hypothetical protein
VVILCVMRRPRRKFAAPREGSGPRRHLPDQGLPSRGRCAKPLQRFGMTHAQVPRSHWGFEKFARSGEVVPALSADKFGARGSSTAFRRPYPATLLRPGLGCLSV